MENTSPIQTQDLKENEKQLKPRRGIWVLIGLLIMLVGSSAGGFLGYQEGLNLRNKAYDEALVTEVTTQFDRAVREMEEGSLQNAQKRLEYVIQHMPEFPGAQDKLTEVMMAQAWVASPTPEPLPTMTATPDMRGEEDLYNQIISYLTAEDWNSAILTMDTIRQTNLGYRTIDVDGLYYLALRNRGIFDILQGSLEPGIYDLALAERFGPLDIEADNYRNWARYYLSGASFWGVDWPQVVRQFGELINMVPNLHDSDGMTVQERYRVGLIKWGDALALREEWCAASEKYEMALAFRLDEVVAPTATAVYNECNKPEETEESQQPTETPTATTETTIEVPTEVTPEPTTEEVPTEPVVTPEP